MAFIVKALPTASEIRAYPAGTAEELVYSTGFENPDAPEFQIAHPKVSFVKGAGSTGNTALKVEGDSNAMLIINLDNGICTDGFKYLVKVLVRGKTRSTDGKVHGSYRFISASFKDATTKKTLDWRQYGVFPFTTYLDDPDDIDAFHEFSFGFYGKPNAFPFLRLTVGAGGPFEGTVFYDDLRIYKCGVDAHINIVKPLMSAFLPNSKEFSFYGCSSSAKEICMMVELMQNGQTFFETVLQKDQNGFFSGTLEKLPNAGNYLFKATLVDITAKKRIKTVDFPVSVRPANEIPPAGAVSFDKNRRLLVDGKPFFALSLGCAQPSKNEHLKRHADAGFNVIDTGPFNLVNYKADDHAKKLREKLDYIHSLGMKIRLSLIDFYAPNRKWLLVKYSEGPKGATELVNAIKDHPAILGYYLLDELTEKDWPQVTAIKNAANLADPYHPCFICTNLLSTTPKIAVTTDVIGYDYYPIGKKGEYVTNASNVDIMAKQTRETGLPFWAIPQAFSWGLYQPQKTPEVFQQFQIPTVNQMFADAVLFALNSATDFWFYTCPLRTDHQKDAERMGVPDYNENMFADIAKMTQHLKKLGEYLLSDRTPEDIPASKLASSGIRVRRYTNAQGRSAVVIFAEGQGPAKASFQLPQSIKWHSEFDHAKQDADGTWLFQADGFAADVLYEE